MQRISCISGTQRAVRGFSYSLSLVAGGSRSSTSQARESTRNTRKHPRRLWTKQEEDLVVALRKAGSRVSEIASQLPHRTERAIEQRIQKNPFLRERVRLRNRRPFGADEDTQIQSLRSAGLSWQRIAQALPGRCPTGVQRRHADLQQPERTLPPRTRFTAAEDLRLRTLRANKGLSWLDIATHFPGRRWKDLANRYHKILPSGQRVHRERPYTITSTDAQQAAKLREKEGTWEAIAEKHGPTSSHKRLSPTVRRYKAAEGHDPSRRPFSEAEDAEILMLKAAGLGWVQMATKIPGRSPAVLSQRYRTLERTDSADHELG